MRTNLPFPHEEGAVEASAAADEEITTALADLGCRNEVEWDTKAAEVQAAMEERFITDHKTELDELIAAVQAIKKK